MKKAPLPSRVTVVWEGKLQRGRWKGGTIRSTNFKHVIRSNVERAAEGAEWIRGWHDASSEEGKALLAAAAMSEGRPRLAQVIAEQVMKRIQWSIDITKLYTRKPL